MKELQKEYYKFMSTATSAALVASAIAPVASAKDFSDTQGNTHEAAIDALSDIGIISGYAEGIFQPNKTLSRSDVVKLLGKWLESEGYKVAADYKTNPRFKDIAASSNEELLKYAALVKDNGVFMGTPDGKLDPTSNITRENMAIVLVRAFELLHDIDLTAFVRKQDFKKDVTDIGQAKAEARPAIGVLDYFDITNPAAQAFNPKTTTTRGHFATLLHKFLNTDFTTVSSAVESDITVQAVKAINATTVEVIFKEAVQNVNFSNYTIDGLSVSNAAVKQSDNKTVVLTTAVQEGGKIYTVFFNNKELGTFEGISTVVPTKVEITTQSVQGKLGQQAILSADVGVKQAGIPITFNVQANTDHTLNKNQVFEAITDKDGIATFSYTQYAVGTDEVTAYPTGTPTVRSLGYVYWGVDTIVSIESTDKKGINVNNGEDKTFKLTYRDPQTGKPAANQRFFVTFTENVDVNIDKTSKATVNGVNPHQLLNNENPVVASITTDTKGEAVFTVSGFNTGVSPIVFMDNGAKGERDAKTYSPSKLQANAEKVTFAAQQKGYSIMMFGTLGDSLEAAIGFENGREFTVIVMNENGEPAANETINIAFNEDLDRNLSTETKAWFVDWNDDSKLKKQISYRTDKDGVVAFNIVSNEVNDYATSIAWIDINSADAREGKYDEGEPYEIGPITYYAESKLSFAGLLATDSNGNVHLTEKETFNGNEAAYIDLFLLNQALMPIDLPVEYSHADVSFSIWNTGENDVRVIYNTGDGTTQSQIVSPNRTYTTTRMSGSRYVNPRITIEPIGDTTTSARITANATVQPDKSLANNKAVPLHFSSPEVNVKFVSTLSIGTIHTGIVELINTDKKTVKFVDKSEISYANASFKNVNAVTISQEAFEKMILANEGTIKVTYVQDGENEAFHIVSLESNVTGATSAINRANNITDMIAALEMHSDELSPKFSVLKNIEQKNTVATDLLIAKSTGTLSNAIASSVYSTSVTNVITKAVSDFKASRTLDNIKLVPTLDLSNVSPSDETAVLEYLNGTKGTAFNGTTIENLQDAVDAAIAAVATNKEHAETTADLVTIKHR